MCSRHFSPLLSVNTIYIRTVSSQHVLSALLNWFKLVSGLFGESTMHGAIHNSQKGIKGTKAKELLSKGLKSNSYSVLIVFKVFHNSRLPQKTSHIQLIFSSGSYLIFESRSINQLLSLQMLLLSCLNMIGSKKILLKFIYSEKATKFCEISTVDLTVTTQGKSTMEISQNFVAFSEYMNFNS